MFTLDFQRKLYLISSLCLFVEKIELTSRLIGPLSTEMGQNLGMEGVNFAFYLSHGVHRIQHTKCYLNLGDIDASISD